MRESARLKAVQDERPIRGDYFVDKLGGWVEILLAAASLGIVAFVRFKKEITPSDVALASLFLLEIVGAILITRSKFGLMRVALWIFAFRVAAGLAYMGVVHGDKLARSTLGFPVVVAIYCWARIRALKERP